MLLSTKKILMNVVAEDGSIRVMSISEKAYNQLQQAAELWARLDRIQACQRNFRVHKSLLRSTKCRQ